MVLAQLGRSISRALQQLSNATVFDERVLIDITRHAGSSSIRCLQNAGSWEALFHSKEREDECCYVCRFTGYVIYQIVFMPAIVTYNLAHIINGIVLWEVEIL